VLNAYEQVKPGTIDRIFAMAESQSQHRQYIERTVVEGNIHVQKLGPWLGFIIAMTVIVGGFWLIYLGKDILGAAAVIGSLASLVGAFVWGKVRQDKQNAAKADAFVRAAQALPEK
jgi:uncharacterized membrane protein